MDLQQKILPHTSKCIQICFRGGKSGSLSIRIQQKIETIQKKHMANFFKSKSYHTAHSHLQNTGFFNSDFSNFRIMGIVTRVRSDRSLFPHLIQVLQEVKLTPSRVLKIQLIIQHLLQEDVFMQENEILFQLLVKISIKVKKMMNSSENIKPLIVTQNEENANTSKEMNKQSQLVCQNGKSLILKKIIQPMLDLQKRLIFCYDLIFPSRGSLELQISECWAVLNLLKKFVQISPQIQAIGRYYSKKYATAMIFLIKVLDTDIQVLYNPIQKLYRRVKTFIDRKIHQYEGLLKQKPLVCLQKQHSARMKEFIQLIEELQVVDEYIKLLYLNKSFKDDLASNNIAMPSLFTTNANIDLLRYLQKSFLRKRSHHSSYCSTSTKQVSPSSQDVQEV